MGGIGCGVWAVGGAVWCAGWSGGELDGGVGGGGMRDAMSLPHLASPQVFRHIAPQYYSQVSGSSGKWSYYSQEYKAADLGFKFLSGGVTSLV